MCIEIRLLWDKKYFQLKLRSFEHITKALGQQQNQRNYKEDLY